MSSTKKCKLFKPRTPGGWLRLFINVLIAAALVQQTAVFGSSILNRLQSGGSRDISVSTSEIEPSTGSGQAARSYASQDIADLHMFGQANENTSETTEPVVAPETKLDLTLRGIFSGDNVDHSFAIIQNNRDKKERYFTIQQKVFELATLKEIYDDRIILLINGQYETLKLPKDSLSREHFYDSAEIQAEKKRIVTNYRDRFLAGDGMDLIKLFGFEEAFKGGSFIGFRVKALGEEGREMMATLGIEDGDLITVLNGMRFSDGLEGIEEIKKLKTATSADVIIDRNGNEIPFHFEFETAFADPGAEEAVSGPVYGKAGDVSQASGNPQPLTEANDNALVTSPGFVTPSSAGSRLVEKGGDKGSSTPVSAVVSPVSIDDEDLGVDWDESQQAEEYRAKQRERTTGVSQSVEFDH
ncbi:type II secretion system protein C [Thiogranum longum]|uniref:Type II secretion system protein C n=1 Tax=Thiogranum longum TaxID=1537524 RepID=A0A4R1HC61_9GAMM|nr:type II secretion system protein N [Thiogranum longum]TCK19018.1 type II secretion system protein C [Thiogranum longum]